MPLHLDYRPQNFEEIIGNKSIVESLRSILAREDRPHCYMFTGPKGCGKTTFARILAKALGCEDMEIHEYDTSNVRGIDEIQEIKRQSFFAPLSGKIRVNIFDEAHEITKKGAEAMLKFLEDTPAHIYNILCTTNPEKIPETVQRRCTYYTVKTLLSREMESLLNWVLKSEDVVIPESVGKVLISASDGCPGILLVKLDQVIDIKGEESQLGGITNFTTENAQIIDICRVLTSNEKGHIRWEALSKMLKDFESDPEQTRRAILGYLAKVLIGAKDQKARRTALVMSEFMNNYYDNGKSGLVSSCYMTCLI
jgi:DNA polymerase-3 subunit gamma/tau